MRLLLSEVEPDPIVVPDEGDIPLDLLALALLPRYLLTALALLLLLLEATLEFRLRRVLLLELFAEGTLALALLRLALTLDGLEAPLGLGLDRRQPSEVERLSPVFHGEELRPLGGDSANGSVPGGHAVASEVFDAGTLEGDDDKERVF